MRTSVILLAAGRGRRMGQDTNKVYLPILGVPILRRAAEALGRVPAIDELIVVAHPEELAIAADLLPPLDIPVRVVEGGAERQDSALAGAAAASGDILLIHDAARPFPPRDLVERVIEGASRHGACIPVVPVVDTLRRVGADGFASPEAVDRAGLVRVQTPQGFRAALLREALRAWPAATLLSDDAAAVLARGYPVAVVDGDAGNIKVTTPADLDLAALIAARKEQH